MCFFVSLLAELVKEIVVSILSNNSEQVFLAEGIAQSQVRGPYKRKKIVLYRDEQISKLQSKMLYISLLKITKCKQILSTNAKTQTCCLLAICSSIYST